MAFRLNLLKREFDEMVPLRDITNDVLESDFIPFACHYDPETLLTKNGELMQTIKMVGFSFESVESKGLDLRETIRTALQDGITSNSFAVWFHTIRRKKNLNPKGEYTELFPNYVHEAWKTKHDWEHRYTNELFITIVRDGETGTIKNAPRFLRSLFPARDNTERHIQLHLMHEELKAVTTRVLSHLQSYGARKLGTYKENDIHYSEPLRFLGKILKLTEEEIPLTECDLSAVLATHDVTFGFDTLEVRSPAQERRFGAILTIKEYRELSLASIDEFLQLPEEFIVTQCMDFIQSKRALKQFQYQNYITTLSKDEHLAKVSGLRDIVESDHGRATDYGEHQLTILLLAEDVKHLNRYIESSVEALSSLGIVAMREDLRLEDCYWAQLPGNFPFLKRLKPINASRIGGFANLSNYPAGKATGHLWGPAVTVFSTAAQTPYFFDFHSGKVGHTTIIGPNGAGKTVLLNFLLSEARKFNNKLFFFDQNHGAEIFIRALGGKYTSISTQQSSVAMNPLQLPDTNANRNFLLLWTEALMRGTDGVPLSTPDELLIEQALVHLLGLPAEQRHVRGLAYLIGTKNPELAQRLSIWHSGGRYASLFDHPKDMLDMSNPIAAFEMAEVVQEKLAGAATLLYILHRIAMQMDGSPTIIVLDEAWEMLDNPIFAPRMHSWLEALTSQNALAILATESVDDASKSSLNQTMFSDIATQIYLPNEQAGEAYKTVFGLNNTEFKFLELMDADEHHFMLKKGGDTIVAKLSLKGMDEILSVLSATPEALVKMHELIATHGESPQKWLPIFMEHMRHAHKQR